MRNEVLQAILTPDQAKDFAAGKWHVNPHTQQRAARFAVT